ncbi:hypothetical protein N9506_00025 [Pseudomonadales bacterium]|nr:hypothetical protein [Pseudomonadales bacterium]
MMIPLTVRGEGQSFVRTTSSQIAIQNLDYLIRRGELQVSAAPGDSTVVAAYLEVLLLRVRFLNTFSDFDRALQVTQELARRSPNDPRALLHLARVMLTLHRFPAALALLGKAHAKALALPVDQQSRFQRELDLQYVTIKLARAETDQALSMLEKLRISSDGVKGAADLSVFFAAAYKSLGLLEAADAELLKSLELWDRITPLYIAWISLQRGDVWVGVDDARARRLYEEALHYLPEYVSARIHLAELKMQGGDSRAALALLTPIAKGQDPEPAGRLAEYLEAAGQGKVSAPYREMALHGWQALLDRYPLAFADHAAEFWLGAGKNPELALEWAAENYKNRPTPSAKALLLEATLATVNFK